MADEPELGITVAGPDRIEEEEEEHYIARGFDPEGDDLIGADEEWRYFKKQQMVLEGGSNEKVQQEKNKVEKKGNVYEGTDPDAILSDETTMMSNATYFAHTTYLYNTKAGPFRGWWIGPHRPLTH